MPYYAWRSVNEAGVVGRGVSFAQSVEELDAVLLRQRKALIASRLVRQRGRSRELMRFLHEDFFSHFAHLVGAGVLVPDALELCARQTDSSDVRHAILALGVRVNGGASLSSALAAEQSVFSPMTVSMIKVGEETGSLVPVAAVLSLYAQNDAAFYKRLQSALLGPLVTLLFFLTVAAVFLMVAVPHFASMMLSLGVEMPPLTRGLLATQEFLAGWGSVIALGGLVSFVFLIRYFLKRYRDHENFQGFLLKVPLYGDIVRLRTIAQMSRALALLIENGVPIPAALAITQGVVTNPILKRRVAELEEFVRAGYAVSDALEMVGQGWLSHDIPALVKLGEASGRLAPLFDQIAQRTQARLDALLARVTTLIQPASMLLLGVLVALLIAAIYVPLLELAKGV
jgi:type II secretory pathway component PulF